MKIIKENWKMVVFIILAIFLLQKIDNLVSILNKTDFNGRFTMIQTHSGIQLLDTRNGKVYYQEREFPKVGTWKQTIKEVK